MPYTVKKIDIHVHSMENYGMSFYRSNGETYATPEEVRRMYDDMGIEWGILLPELNPEGMHRTISNEEAKLIGMEGNRRLNGEIYAGPMLIVGDDGVGGTMDLTNEQIAKYTKMFERPEDISPEEVESSAGFGIYGFY